MATPALAAFPGSCLAHNRWYTCGGLVLARHINGHGGAWLTLIDSVDSSSKTTNQTRIRSAVARLIVGWRASVLLMITVASFASGCGPQWVYTFVEAEKLARDKEKPIFVFYRDPFDPKSGQMFETVQSPEAVALLQNMVTCTLVTEYNPNRRFMAQYNVIEAPAMTIIHPDGTYHSQNGTAGLAEIREFIQSSQPPGEKPSVDIQVPRPTDYILRAEGDYDNALAAANRQNRKLLIVYKWWLDADSTELIRRMSRPEVAARVGGAVHCVLDSDYVPNRKYVSQYGVDQYPAIIVVHQDGTADKLEGLSTVDQIVGFLSRALSQPASRQPRVSRTPRVLDDWSQDFVRSRIQSQRTNTGLFVFCHSPMSNESLRMDAMLSDTQARSILSGAIKCRVNFSSPDMRQLMADYGVHNAPGYAAIRPDGVFASRQGVISYDDLQHLRRFLDTR